MPDDSQKSVEELSHRIDRLEMLLKISRMMNATSNQERLITKIAEEVGSYVHADRCSIFFYDELADELYTHLAIGLEKGEEIRIPTDTGIAGHVFLSGEVMNVPDVKIEPMFTGESDRRTGYNTTSLLTYPLTGRRGIRIGVFQLLNKHGETEYFTADDEAFLADLVDQIAGLLELILRKDQLAQRNAVLEIQMEQLSSFEYLIGDRTAIYTTFRYNRKVHYWGGLGGLLFLTLMAVTSLGMVHFDDFRSLMLGLHTGTGLGLGYRYFIYTDIVSIVTILVCLSGLLMYIYPPLNRWLKTQKNKLLKERFDTGRQAAGNGKKQAD